MNLQLNQKIDAVVFDCDGTLSKLEGIVELARMNGVEKQVADITERAMSDGIFDVNIYEQRLALTKPSKTQLETLGKDYFVQATPDIQTVLNFFRRQRKEVFMVTAGLTPAVEILAKQLQIKRDNIFAVDISFDEQGEYLSFDRNSPLVEIQGKYKVVRALKESYPNILHVGDGMNDYSTFELVTRFVGYGGAYFRQRMAELCDFYIHSKSILPLIPLSLTQEEADALNAEDQALYRQGLTLLLD